MHNITQCIREHQEHVSNSQNIRNNEMSALQAKYDGILQVIDEFKNGIKDTYITTTDINDLVTDIKDSLIMLMNTTPRNDLDKIATLEERLSQLEMKQEENEKAIILDDIRMPIKINVRETPHEAPIVPKIDLKKRKV